MMGSGGMIVMDDKTCMVDVAKYFLSFLVSESCGKCIPCREGLYQLHKMAVAMSEGKASEGDLEKMEQLSEMVDSRFALRTRQVGSESVPVDTSIFPRRIPRAYPRQEMPGRRLSRADQYEVDRKMHGCLACITACAYNAITGRKGELH